MDEIVDAELLQLQNDGPEIGPEDFRISVLLHLVLVGFLGVKSETLSGLRSAGTAGSLLGRGLADGRNEKRFDANSRVVYFLLRKTCRGQPKLQIKIVTIFG